MDISKMNPGDVFYESAYGKTVKLFVKTKPVLKIVEREGEDNWRQWSWIAVGEDGNSVDYLVTENSGYGPNLFEDPSYLTE